jgi:hypothetical protein
MPYVIVKTAYQLDFPLDDLPLAAPAPVRGPCVTRLSRYQHDTQRICADDPSASVCAR